MRKHIKIDFKPGAYYKINKVMLAWPYDVNSISVLGNRKLEVGTKFLLYLSKYKIETPGVIKFDAHCFLYDGEKVTIYGSQFFDQNDIVEMTEDDFKV